MGNAVFNFEVGSKTRSKYLMGNDLGTLVTIVKISDHKEQERSSADRSSLVG